MNKSEVLTPEDLSARWKGKICPGTLQNWRCNGTGPNYTKVGRAVFYPLSEVERFERENVVHARGRAPKRQAARTAPGGRPLNR
jgi:hypothetical protein